MLIDETTGIDDTTGKKNTDLTGTPASVAHQGQTCGTEITKTYTYKKKWSGEW